MKIARQRLVCRRVRSGCERRHFPRYETIECAIAPSWGTRLSDNPHDSLYQLREIGEPRSLFNCEGFWGLLRYESRLPGQSMP